MTELRQGENPNVRGRQALSLTATTAAHVDLQFHAVASRLFKHCEERLTLGLEVFFGVHASIDGEHATARDDIEVGARLDTAADEHQRSPGGVWRHPELRAATFDSARQPLQSDLDEQQGMMPL